MNDTQGSKDGIPLAKRLGRRLTEAAPGREAETLEAVMRQVLESGDPAINVDYQAFLPHECTKQPHIDGVLLPP